MSAFDGFSCEFWFSLILCRLIAIVKLNCIIFCLVGNNCSKKNTYRDRVPLQYRNAGSHWAPRRAEIPSKGDWQCFCAVISAATAWCTALLWRLLFGPCLLVPVRRTSSPPLRRPSFSRGKPFRNFHTPGLWSQWNWTFFPGRKCFVNWGKEITVCRRRDNRYMRIGNLPSNFSQINHIICLKYLSHLGFSMILKVNNADLTSHYPNDFSIQAA